MVYCPCVVQADNVAPHHDVYAIPQWGAGGRVCPMP